ncbi:hypothetical protein ABZT06_08900 [Streptomyces sp. NPDC005483]|uniref:hypothetical protein n=1 Tax=Streptomyces sp. NPDC005483 TaxID=3154882 RepID=UPI0033A3ADC5
MQSAGGDAPGVMQQQAVLHTSDIVPGLLATGRVDDSQYAIRQGHGTETVVYDVKTWEDSGATGHRAGRYFAVLRRRLQAGDLATGAVAQTGALLFLADLADLADLAPAGARLSGAPLFAVVAAGIGTVALVVGLRACARPESLTDWPTAVREAVRDVGGSTQVLLAVATAALCAWMLVPPGFLVPGPPARALTAVHVRPAAMSGSQGARGAG